MLKDSISDLVNHTIREFGKMQLKGLEAHLRRKQEAADQGYILFENAFGSFCLPMTVRHRYRRKKFKEKTGDFAGIGGRPESDEHVSLHTPPP